MEIRHTCSPNKNAGRFLPGKFRTIVTNGPGSRSRNSAGHLKGKVSVEGARKRKAAVVAMLEDIKRRSRRSDTPNDYSAGDDGVGVDDLPMSQLGLDSDDSSSCSESDSDSDSDSDAYNNESLETKKPSVYQKVGMGRDKPREKRSKHVKDAMALDEHWKTFIEINTGKRALLLDFSVDYRCDCNQKRVVLPVLRLNCICCTTIALTLAYQVERFMMCASNCPHAQGFLGLTTRNYYPSSPVLPKYAISFEVFELYHGIHMKGSASKQVFCDSLKSLLRKLQFVSL
jgi:hypothetical protein